MPRAVAVSAFLILLVLTGPVDAHRPILHERIPSDAREDALFGATTLDGKMPSTLATPSGFVGAPDTKRPPSPDEATYSETVSSTGQSTAYEADRDTRSPNSVGYSEPFTPSIAPYKRVQVFDWVRADEHLVVRNPLLTRIPIGGDPQNGDDLFFGDMTVDLTVGLPVRVPSVASGARLLRLSTVPAMPVELLRDEAENWFLRGPKGAGRIRLLLELAAPRATFGGPVHIGRPLQGSSFVPAAADNVTRDAARVARSIGITGSMSLDQVLEAMVSYFRGFTASESPPTGRQNVYLDLALSQKGVCRHRAYAFVVTALGLGLPARMVTNEAHAWVEVRGDDQLWHRIDLGGAASEISVHSEARPAYKAPGDRFPWPAAAERFSGTNVLSSSTGSTSSGGGFPASTVTGRDPGKDSAENGEAGERARRPGGDGSAAQLGGPAERARPGGGETAVSVGERVEGEPQSTVSPPPSSVSPPPSSVSPPPSSVSPPPSSVSPPTLTSGVVPVGSSGQGGTAHSPWSAGGPESPTGSDSPSQSPAPRVFVRAERQVERGGPLAVEGQLRSGRSSCPDAVVQLTLQPRGDGPPVPLGSLVPQPNGSFSGTLYVPRNIKVGVYDLSATLPACDAD